MIYIIYLNGTNCVTSRLLKVAMVYIACHFVRGGSGVSLLCGMLFSFNFLAYIRPLENSIINEKCKL